MAHGSHEKVVRPVTKKNTARSPAVKAEPKGAMKIVRKLKELTRRELWTKVDPDHSVDWTDDRVWDKIKNEGCYHRADEMLVSCGTVTISQPDSLRPMVLLVFNKNIGIFQLPKGRKNFDEGYLAAALRETAEETGVAARSLRLRFGSRSTPPKNQSTQPRVIEYGKEDRDTGITEGLSNESIGASEWYYQCIIDPDPATGAWRHIYWYAAQPLGDTRRDESRMTDAEDRKKFTTYWFSETEAITRLKLEDEKFMVRITFAYLRNMSDEDWESNKKQEERENNEA
ncbi:uncharacterized protein F4822DRAFT_441173 [Hypoxylon trugodes]|uniref:uncharacterized protein n=1 Tax=Hypoxylon trugodes TaxID=326681 RepID=UPI00219F7C5F|nr:uncharacterized protein F4822DRAFT_441173 [Hypoxylon trugodes]KAI1391994.1 hypothetical protein F4822DRAFT_441173 [Hypoxylon trugodes]